MCVTVAGYSDARIVPLTAGMFAPSDVAARLIAVVGEVHVGRKIVHVDDGSRRDVPRACALLLCAPFSVAFFVSVYG